MINFEEALDHPFLLFPYFYSMLIKNKSKLPPMLTPKSNEENADASKESTTCVVDLMALMRVVMAIRETFKDLAL